MATELGISERKLRAVREWLILMGLVQTTNGQSGPSTDAPLYRRIHDVEPDAFLELVYYRLCTRNRHFSELVNVFLADRVRRFGRSPFATEHAEAWFRSWIFSPRTVARMT